MNGHRENPHNLLMKAVIIYDHVMFATKVDSLLRLVGNRASVRVEWVITYYPVKALNDAVLAKKALFESQDAHLVVLPVRYARAVPTGLFIWLNEWAQEREICDAALGFTAENDSAVPPQPLCSELSLFMGRYGLHLITGESRTSNDSIKINVEFSSECQTPVSFKRAGLGLPATHQSYRGMGIND